MSSKYLPAPQPFLRRKDSPQGEILQAQQENKILRMRVFKDLICLMNIENILRRNLAAVCLLNVKRKMYTHDIIIWRDEE
jgi:hypothetical protein